MCVSTHIIGWVLQGYEGQFVVGDEERAESPAVPLAERRQHHHAVRRSRHQLACGQQEFINLSIGYGNIHVFVALISYTKMVIWNSKWNVIEIP